MISKHLFDPGSTLLRVMVDFFFLFKHISQESKSLFQTTSSCLKILSKLMENLIFVIYNLGFNALLSKTPNHNLKFPYFLYYTILSFDLISILVQISLLERNTVIFNYSGIPSWNSEFLSKVYNITFAVKFIYVDTYIRWFTSA